MKKKSTIIALAVLVATSDDGKVNGEVLQSSEANERLLAELKAAIRAGLDSGVAEMFDPIQHLEVLKVARRNR